MVCRAANWHMAEWCGWSGGSVHRCHIEQDNDVTLATSLPFATGLSAAIRCDLRPAAQIHNAAARSDEILTAVVSPE